MRVGDEAPPREVGPVERTMFVRYAGASGDFNPIHFSEDFATQAGYPTVFAQGMFTAGVLAGMLTSWLGATTVRRYGVRFTGQVWPGERLMCTGRVTDVRMEGGHTEVDCELAVTNTDGDRKIAGWATCALDG
jgi:acyl dehydratase